MSTTTTTTTSTIDPDLTPVGFSREVSVEWRKMIDTRSGLWLFIVTGGLIALSMGLTLLVLVLNDDVTITASGFSQIMTIPVSILMPVFAILTVTSEWSQRTHLTSFTIEPSRLRLMTAKFVAVTILALLTIIVAIGAGALGNVLYGLMTGNDVIWNVPVDELAWTIGLQLCFFWMAFALASLILSTPAALAVFYVVALMLPMIVYPALIAIFDWAGDLIPWLDFNHAAMPLMTGADFLDQAVDVGPIHYVRFVFTIFLWIVVPMTLGFARIRRTEIK